MTERELAEIEERLRQLAVFTPDEVWRVPADRAREMLSHAQTLVADVRQLHGARWGVSC